MMPVPKIKDINLKALIIGYRAREGRGRGFSFTLYHPLLKSAKLHHTEAKFKFFTSIFAIKTQLSLSQSQS